MEPVNSLTINKRPKDDSSDDENSDIQMTASERLSLVSSWFVRSCFEEDIPKEIMEIIIAFSKTCIESVILTKEEQKYLLEIIDARRETQQFKCAEWKLLCRGSRDGKTQKAFHDACDEQKHTICLPDVDSTGYVCGG